MSYAFHLLYAQSSKHFYERRSGSRNWEGDVVDFDGDICRTIKARHAGNEYYQFVVVNSGSLM